MSGHMSCSWQQEWLAAHSGNLAMENAWRGVETQYIAASMKLVDSLEEQDLLEALLEGNKPPPQGQANRQHYLLLSPFRYFPQHESRFRPAQRSGLWYGAATLDGACSEVAYWRLRFLRDSTGLAVDGELITEHTFFQASVNGRAINLMAEPWSKLSHLWKHSSDYRQTQALAEAARQASIDWIQYESVRAPCCALAAVLTPAAVRAAPAKLERSKQEWVCKTTRHGVMMIRKNGMGRFEWRETDFVMAGGSAV